MSSNVITSSGRQASVNTITGGNDWRRQWRDRITSAFDLAERLNVPSRRRAEIERVTSRYPLSITPYYFGLIDPDDGSDPIMRQCVPSAAELNNTPRYDEDPFGEAEKLSSCGVIQRYANRAVFPVNDECAVRCRHCTRKNIWRATGLPAPSARLENAVRAISGNPGIQEVILSGGDPLVMETSDLARVIDAFRAIPHVAVIRIGTRVPVTMPMRIDAELCRMLAVRRPLWINTHFNHAREITPVAAAACDRLLRSGIPLSNQTVLLRGVNDSFPVLHALCEQLFQIMVRPYYLFEVDPVRGAAHFRVSRRRGRALHARLRSTLSGLALPVYAADVGGLPHKQSLS